MMQPAEKVEVAKQGYRRYACPVWWKRKYDDIFSLMKINMWK